MEEKNWYNPDELTPEHRRAMENALYRMNREIQSRLESHAWEERQAQRQDWEWSDLDKVVERLKNAPLSIPIEPWWAKLPPPPDYNDPATVLAGLVGLLGPPSEPSLELYKPYYSRALDPIIEPTED